MELSLKDVDTKKSLRIIWIVEGGLFFVMSFVVLLIWPDRVASLIELAPYLFGLIAVTGMRLSEAIGLQRDDVDLEAGVLTVRMTKFGKSRLVPLHPTTRAALRNYAERRDAHLGSRCIPRFFVAERGGPLLHQYVHRVFWRLSREIGLRRPGDRTGPRVHDFRHRFAIRTLLGWYREGTDVEKKLPALSTYLGHTCVRDTYWYLSACPGLMQEAARRLDRRWEVKQ